MVRRTQNETNVADTQPSQMEMRMASNQKPKLGDPAPKLGAPQSEPSEDGETRNLESGRVPSLGHPALDALAGAVGGRNVLFGIGGAILLIAAAGAVGLFPPLLNGGAGGSGSNPPVSASAPSLFTPVTAADLDKAISLLALADADKAKVRAEVQKGAMRLALITVVDNDAEDGDWVSVLGAGFRQDIRLFLQPYTVAVPYLPGAPVLVRGLKDGGGGDITVTVMVGAAKLSLKPLKEGETLQLTPP